MKDTTTGLLVFGMWIFILLGFSDISVRHPSTLPFLTAVLFFRVAMLTERDHLDLLIGFRGADQVGRNLFSGRDEWPSRKTVNPVVRYQYLPLSDDEQAKRAIRRQQEAIARGDYMRSVRRESMDVRSYAVYVENWQSRGK